MKRMDYISEEKPEMAIYKARELHPEFPGIIDLACWEIGVKYCEKENPKCESCIVKSECEKRV
jgi:adenine-specific DNA glycosylase